MPRSLPQNDGVRQSVPGLIAWWSRSFGAARTGAALLALICAAAGWALGRYGPSAEPRITHLSPSEAAAPVAVVNGTPISQGEFIARLEREAGGRILDQMISERVVLDAEQSENVPIHSTDIAAERARIRSQYETEAAYQHALAESGLTPDRLEDEIRMSLIVERLSTQGVTVSDAEVRAAFEKEASAFGEPERVRVSQILTKTRSAADEVYRELAAGADFAALARRRSEDPISRAKGGDIGYLAPESNLSQPLKSALLRLQPGEVSQPIETPLGYYIFKATERVAARPARFADHAEAIRARLLAERARSTDDVVALLRRKAKIELLWKP